MQESVILYRTYDRALAARKELARRGVPTLGASPTTSAAYLADCWALWGDGRRVVGPRERLLLVADVLEGHPGALLPSLGTTQVISGFLARYAGADALARALEGDGPAEALTESECAALEVMGAYLDSLVVRGLVEEQAAAWQLAEGMPRGGAAVSVGEPLFLAPGSAAWLASQMAEPLPCGPFALPALPQGVEPRFAFPAGRTALARALRDEVTDAIAWAEGPSVLSGRSAAEGLAEGALHGAGTLGLDGADGAIASAAPWAGAASTPVIVLCAPDALALFDALAPSLALEGAACSVQASVPFAETALGRALAAVRELLDEVPAWRQAATDFAYSPLAGVAPFEAQGLNGAWRGDRLATAAAACAQLRSLSPTFSLFEAVLAEQSPQALEALGVALAEGALVPATAAVQERAALQALERLLGDAEALGVPARLDELAPTLSVPLSQVIEPEGALRAQVAFCSLQAMDGLAPASAYEVVVADLTDAAFGTAASRSPLDGLAAKLGLPEEPSRLDRWRCAFARAEAAATARFACVAPQRSVEEGEAYPAFLFDELVALLGDDGDLGDGLFAVPAALEESVARLGEEALVSGMGQCFAEPEGWFELPAPERGRLKALAMADFMTMVQEGARQLPVLSPSAMEAYLQCPYKWFVERKLRPEGLDEGFTALERGTFAHGVYQELFERLAAEGVRSLGGAGLPRALEELHRVFDERLAAQAALPPGERYVPVGRVEELEARPWARACGPWRSCRAPSPCAPTSTPSPLRTASTTRARG